MFNHNRWKNKQKESRKAELNKQKIDEQDYKEDIPEHLSTDVIKNTITIQKILEYPSDLTIRKLNIGKSNHQLAIAFIQGLVDTKVISEDILEKITISFRDIGEVTETQIIAQLEKEILSVAKVEVVNLFDDIMLEILSGNTVLFIDGIDQALILSTRSPESRAIMEPTSEALVRGPKEGFIENLQTNLMMIRKQIRDPNLRFESFKIGRRAKKTLIITYVDGIVNPMLVTEVKRRIDSIDVDTALDTGTIEQWIEDSFLSPFPQISNTERPDKVSIGLMQGQIGIILEGTPFALVLPHTLAQGFQTPEDYYERWIVSSLIRSLRYAAAFIAMFLPALYIALVSYHPGMIPSTLAFSITATREGVPVPAVMEAILMEVTMELLREAGIRLPKAIGQTIGIVGGLVIGEAAVAAGIVSPIMVIVVALTAIASFAIPSYSTSLSFRFLRFHFMIAAAVLGLYGIIVGYIMINIHIANLKSFGVPYSSPFAPVFFKDWNDLILRLPNPMQKKRPAMFQTKDPKKVNKGGQENNE